MTNSFYPDSGVMAPIKGTAFNNMPIIKTWKSK